MSPPRRKPIDLEGPTEILPLRPSQAAVDRVFQVKGIGIIATVLFTVLPGVFIAVPWYADRIILPESQARVGNAAMMARAYEQQQENEKTRLMNDGRTAAAYEAFTSELRGLRADVKELRTR